MCIEQNKSEKKFRLKWVCDKFFLYIVEKGNSTKIVFNMGDEYTIMNTGKQAFFPSNFFFFNYTFFFSIPLVFRELVYIIWFVIVVFLSSIQKWPFFCVSDGGCFALLSGGGCFGFFFFISQYEFVTKILGKCENCVGCW